MPDLWVLIAFQLLAVGGGVVTAVASLLIGGVGGVHALARRIKVLEDRTDDVDRRITSEVKKRAGAMGGATRTSAAELNQEATRRLAEGGAVSGATTRPSVVR